ncbi:MAG: hypothetical protein IPK13_14845 [Deltaproteobacteria bacterium]|nr:hypothetical protein [Deltaproteobacteria bacterium]
MSLFDVIGSYLPFFLSLVTSRFLGRRAELSVDAAPDLCPGLCAKSNAGASCGLGFRLTQSRAGRVASSLEMSDPDENL